MSELGDVLNRLEMPDAREARESTADALVARFGAEPRSRATSRRKFAWAGACAALLVVAFLALTPPGRSAVSWAAELLGIGDVGGPPTLDDRPDNAAPAGAQVVIGNGTDPAGDRFEVVAFTQGGKADDANTCAFLDFPGRSAAGGKASAGACLDGPEPQGALQLVSTSFPEDDAAPYVLGFTGPAASRVELEADGKPAETSLFELSGDLQASVGAPKPLGVFVAFLPRQVTQAPGPALDATSFDEAGDILATVSQPAVAAGQAPDSAIDLCREVLQEDPEHEACRALLDSAD